MAKGILLALVVKDLQNMNIHSNFNTICTGLLKHAIEAFRENIWKPRCTLNADKEKRLGITKAEKRFYTPANPRSHNFRTSLNIPGHYQILLERWKRNWNLGHKEMVRYVTKGSNGFDNGWATCRYNIKNLARDI